MRFLLLWLTLAGISGSTKRTCTAYTTTSSLSKHNNGVVQHEPIRRHTTTRSSTTTTIASGDDTTTTNLTAADLDKIQPRIVGGSVVTDSQAYPSYVFTAGTILCGGTLIYEDIVLSAAHCGAEAFKPGVLIGGIDVNGSPGSENRQVQGTLLHPDYNTVNQDNDIMLIKLSSPSTAPVQSLNFDPTNPADNELVTVIGYGDTISGVSSFSNDLLEVDVNVISQEDCNTFYGIIKIDIHVCAGLAAGGKDSCQGDSGGPLLTQTGEQIGIVSYSQECGKANVPSVYTRVSGYEDFIQKGICDLSNNPPDSCSSNSSNVATTTTTAPVTVPTGSAPTATAPVVPPPVNAPSSSSVTAPVTAPVPVAVPVVETTLVPTEVQNIVTPAPITTVGGITTPTTTGGDTTTTTTAPVNPTTPVAVPSPISVTAPATQTTTLAPNGSTPADVPVMSSPVTVPTPTMSVGGGNTPTVTGGGSSPTVMGGGVPTPVMVAPIEVRAPAVQQTPSSPTIDSVTGSTTPLAPTNSVLTSIELPTSTSSSSLCSCGTDNNTKSKKKKTKSKKSKKGDTIGSTLSPSPSILPSCTCSPTLEPSMFPTLTPTITMVPTNQDVSTLGPSLLISDMTTLPPSISKKSKKKKRRKNNNNNPKGSSKKKNVGNLVTITDPILFGQLFQNRNNGIRGKLRVKLRNSYINTMLIQQATEDSTSKSSKRSSKGNNDETISWKLKKPRETNPILAIINQYDNEYNTRDGGDLEKKEWNSNSSDDNDNDIVNKEVIQYGIELKKLLLLTTQNETIQPGNNITAATEEGNKEIIDDKITNNNKNDAGVEEDNINNQAMKNLFKNHI